jgi:hypothetical protein
MLWLARGDYGIGGSRAKLLSTGLSEDPKAAEVVYPGWKRAQLGCKMPINMFSEETRDGWGFGISSLIEFWLTGAFKVTFDLVSEAFYEFS